MQIGLCAGHTVSAHLGQSLRQPALFVVHCAPQPIQVLAAGNHGKLPYSLDLKFRSLRQP